MLLLIYFAVAWLSLNVMAVAMCRLMARAEDVHVSLAPVLCGLGEAAGARVLPFPHRRPSRGRRRAHCRRVAPAAMRRRPRSAWRR